MNTMDNYYFDESTSTWLNVDEYNEMMAWIENDLKEWDEAQTSNYTDESDLVEISERDKLPYPDYNKEIVQDFLKEKYSKGSL